MPRTLLLVICDFLLLSLLALVRFDQVESSQAGSGGGDETVALQQSVGVETDLMEILQLSLELEEASRGSVEEELRETREELQERERLLAEREENIARLAQEMEQREETLQERDQAIAERDQSLEEIQSTLQRTEEQLSQEARRATEGLERVERLEERLEERMQEERRLRDSLGETRQIADVREEQLRQARAELEEKLSALGQTETLLAEMEERQRSMEEESRELAERLNLTEREKQLIEENLESARSEVSIVRQEKERIHEQATELARGVGVLAEQSEELAREIRSSRQSDPISPNRIFRNYQESRLETSFSAFREAVLFSGDRERDTSTVKVTDGHWVYTLLHINDIPMSFRDSGPHWRNFQGRISRDGEDYSLEEILFSDADPRILLAPVEFSESERLGGRIYALAEDPFAFDEAVIVSSDGEAYGEVGMVLDSDHPNYVKVDRREIRFLRGDFSPSTGDLVFSRRDELIGIMVNRNYCLVLENFLHAGSIPLAGRASSEEIFEAFSAASRQLRNLPGAVRN
ncbi:MAG: hypothetical protein JJT75_04275 [Opitutales bacterium]|nr:hypothetical protein [Opitutales bacterium]